MIRLFPDPVVVASTGPLPSATLHETAASFRHECLDTFTIGKGDGRCQEIMRQHRRPALLGQSMAVTKVLQSQILADKTTAYSTAR